MKIALVVSALGVIAMTSVILYGFIVGDFSSDGALILGNPWGIVSLVDLYVGFILFALWVWFKESSLLVKVIWVVLLMTTGFLAGSLYVFISLIKSNNNWHRFFLGKHEESRSESVI